MARIIRPYEYCRSELCACKIIYSELGGERMKKLKSIIFGVSLVVSVFVYNILTFASSADVDAPTLPEVRSIVGDGLDLFFGALGAFSVIMGGIEFYKAFLAYRDSVNKGGYGESKSNFVQHIIAGVLCLIGAVLIFVVLGWTKDLFSI